MISNILRNQFDATGIAYDETAEIQPGDYYLACRNTGVKILTCREVHPRGWIVPVEMAYAYDTHECVKVIAI